MITLFIVSIVIWIFSGVMYWRESKDWLDERFVYFYYIGWMVGMLIVLIAKGVEL